MVQKETKPPPFQAIGRRIKVRREGKGLSRPQLARELAIDKTSISGWEQGLRLPRPPLRVKLAQILGIDVDELFSASVGIEEAHPLCAALVDTLEELPGLLMKLLNSTQHLVRAARLAAPYTTPAFVQQEFRTALSKRILNDSLEVQRIEIFYDLRRVQEVLSNILRYDGHAYYVKSYCAGITEVVPAIGGYFFDRNEFILGAYWASIPPHHRIGLRVSGKPFQLFFEDYWDEIWRRGTYINARGSHDLSVIQSIAVKLGLKSEGWADFVATAKVLDVGDGAPLLV
jgi:transcriptional regulator with XRE-family HTH domain